MDRAGCDGQRQRQGFAKKCRSTSPAGNSDSSKLGCPREALARPRRPAPAPGRLHRERRPPVRLRIDAIEDSDLLTISKQDLDALFLRIPQLERFFRILAENALAAYQQRLVDNLSLPAKERYGNFVKLYPSLAGTLSQKSVASYIGVTPEFLSKMLNAQK